MKQVYFIRPVGAEGPVKIGFSSNIEKRLDQLSIWSPFPLEVAVAIEGDGTLERMLHCCFADLHTHKEWFKASPRISDLIAKLRAGVPVRDAIDLKAPTGKLLEYAKRDRATDWMRTERGRTFLSLQTRLRHAISRSRNFGAYPKPVWDLVRASRLRDLTAQERRTIEDYIANPEAEAA